MAGDRWTFLVMRGQDDPVQQYSLSTRTLRMGAWATGAAGFAVLCSVLILAAGALNRFESTGLEARNAALEQELGQFQDRIRTLESTLDQVAANDANFRNLAGLEVIDPEVLEAGVGGPGLGRPEVSPLWSTDSVTTKSIFATSYDLSALERRARLLSESLEEATDSVLAHRNLLESTPSLLPTDGWLSSRFSQSRMHPVHNRPLPHEGVEIDHGFGFTTLYGHASKLIVQVGDEVTRGDVIAQVGSTGITTAPNLHYEVKVRGVPQDPSRFILPDYVRN